MYIYKDKIFSDGGKVLILNGERRLSVNIGGIDISTITEETINTDTISRDGLFIRYDGILQYNYPSYNYDQWKTHLVKQRFTNDDQIAIILNRDSGQKDDVTMYDKMQEWRDWCSYLSRRFVEINAR